MSCEVYDGQFLQLILKDDNAQPLTRMQLCKDISMQCKKMKLDNDDLDLLYMGSQEGRRRM